MPASDASLLAELINTVLTSVPVENGDSLIVVTRMGALNLGWIKTKSISLQNPVTCMHSNAMKC